MNIDAIRTDLALALTRAGFKGYAFVDKGSVDYGTDGAAIVSPPSAIDYFDTQGGTKATFPVTIAMSARYLDQAQKVLDAALSTDTDQSVYQAIRHATSDSWTKATATTVEGHRMVTEGANEVLAVDVLVDVYARR